MADFSIEFVASQLGKTLEGLAPRLEQEMQQAVADITTAAHASMIAQIQSMSMDSENRADYIKGLQINQVSPDTWVIHLDGDWANKLESGFGGYDMKEKLLSSTKTVKVGSRSGEPWVRTSKDGNRYAVVPMQHQPHSKAKASGDLLADIKAMTAKNSKGKDQSILKSFNDPFGKPLTGMVAKASSSTNPNLGGLTKYQHVSESGKLSSVYMTYRIVSDLSAGWQHPGFGGYKLFEKTEEYIQQELENIVKTLL